MSTGSKTTVYAAIAGNLALTITKFAAAAFTQSAAMLAEGIHSGVDTGNGLLLLLGIKLSKRPADDGHPFGHGMELYFWTLVVSLLIFGVGGGVSVYEGILHVLDPPEVSNVVWNYAVLACGFVFEGTTWVIALRGFLANKGGRSTWRTIRATKDPTIFTVLLEDSAALLGIVVAFLGVFLAHRLGNPYFDGAASIVIGVLLMAVASVLAYESRSLLIGESAMPEVQASIASIIRQDEAVETAQAPRTLQLGPSDVLVNLQIQFRRSLSDANLRSAAERLESTIRHRHPEVTQIFVDMASLGRDGRSRPDRTNA